MTDPFRKPVAGEEFIPSARQFGLFIDAAKAAPLKGRDPRPQLGEPDAGIVLVRNDTGADLTADKPVIGLGDPVFDPDDRASVAFERPLYSGIAPTTAGKWAVLKGPLKDGAIGPAVASGVVWVEVSISDAEHGYCEADVANNETDYLISAASGTGQLISQGGTSGTVWASVRISNLPSSTAEEEEEGESEFPDGVTACGCKNCQASGTDTVTGCSTCNPSPDSWLFTAGDGEFIEMPAVTNASSCIWETESSHDFAGEDEDWTLDVSAGRSAGSVTLTHGSLVYRNANYWRCQCWNEMLLDDSSSIDPLDKLDVTCRLCIQPSSTVVASCCENSLPAVLTVTVTATGAWSCANGDTFQITWDAGYGASGGWVGVWTVNASCDCGVSDQCVTVALSCKLVSVFPDVYDWGIGDIEPSPDGCDCDFTGGDSSPNEGGSCDPFLQSWDKTMECGSCGPGSVLLTVTE